MYYYLPGQKDNLDFSNPLSSIVMLNIHAGYVDITFAEKEKIIKSRNSGLLWRWNFVTFELLNDNVELCHEHDNLDNFGDFNTNFQNPPSCFTLSNNKQLPYISIPRNLKRLPNWPNRFSNTCRQLERLSYFLQNF